FFEHGLAGRTTVIDDIATDQETAAAYSTRYEPLNIRALITVPLHCHGRWVASLWVSCHEPRHWTEGEVELVQTLAERLWGLLEQARFAIAAQEGARQQAALYRFANQLQHTTSAEGIYEAALAAIQDALKCDQAAVLLF